MKKNKHLVPTTKMAQLGSCFLSSSAQKRTFLKDGAKVMSVGKKQMKTEEKDKKRTATNHSR